MNKKFIAKLLILFIISVLLVFGLIKLFQNLNYGLDLQGGFEVLYQVEPLNNEKITNEMMTSTYKTISKRIDVLGVSEPEIIVEGNERIRIRLAGVTDSDTARNLLSKTASLTFRDSKDNLLMTSDVLSKANYETDPNTGLPVVALAIKDKDEFYSVTKKISETEDKLIVIWLDFEDNIDSYSSEENCGSLTESKCLSAATVSQGFSSNVIIQGNFSKLEAENLSELINSGSIPTKLTELSSRVVGASFGENSLNKTIIAGIVGILIVMLIMTFAYKFSGLISAFAIILYTFLTFLIFYLIGGVLTLPGIAALVLGIGMAVDANVINFESLKEELSNKQTLKDSFKVAYKKSLITIIDANVTTFIVAIILFMFGESTVKGFSTMLIINIFVTMIVMVFVVKKILQIFINTKYFNKNTNLFIRKRKETKKFDFLKLKNKAFIFSSLIIITGVIFLFTSGLNLGIDYRGGSSITIYSNNIIDTNLVEKIESFNLEVLDIDEVDNTIFIKVKEEISKELSEKITASLDESLSVEFGVVSDVVKKELTKNAIYSVLISIIGIIIYVSIRFSFNYALSAIIALVHDALIVIALFSIFKLEINSIFIAAILTVIGYSINDTIVIFDRIRSNIFNSKDKELFEIINLSLNETIKRTFYTSMTTLVVILSLIFLGAYEIINFNIALFIGVVFGTYSSLFIASAILYRINKNKKEVEKVIIKEEIEEATIKGINS